MEQWKEIDNTDYLISNYGEIKNNRTGNLLKQQSNKKGYKLVRVTVNGEKKTFRIHRLVALFYVKNPDNKPQVNHIDGNKNNNRYDNLEWVTNEENTHHAITNGLWNNVFKASKRANDIKKTPIIATNIETDEKFIFESMGEAERVIGTRHINEVIKGIRTQAKGYRFKYLKGGGYPNGHFNNN